MIEDLLIHRCTIKRPTHAIASQSKTTGSATIATGVPCRLQPSGEAVTQSLMGMSVASSYLAWFAAGVNLQKRDILVWTDRGDGTVSLELTVEGVERLPARDGLLEHHVEASLKLKAA